MLASSSNVERLLPKHGGKSPGTPKSNRNAYKHGDCSAGGIERRLRQSKLACPEAAPTAHRDSLPPSGVLAARGLVAKTKQCHLAGL
jgi:hypothetical protein